MKSAGSFAAGALIAVVFLGALIYFAYPPALEWCMGERGSLMEQARQLAGSLQKCQTGLDDCTASLTLCSTSLGRSNETAEGISSRLAQCESDKAYYQGKLNEKCGAAGGESEPEYRVLFGTMDARGLFGLLTILFLASFALGKFGSKETAFAIGNALSLLLFLLFLLLALGLA